MFDVLGGGNLLTDSPVKRQKRFQSALRKFKRFNLGQYQVKYERIVA